MKGFGELYKSKKKNNKNPNFSKEKIINKAIQLQLMGNLLEAKQHYQNLINQGFNDHRVYSNYGVILQNEGNLKEAQLSYRKAIDLNPRNAEAHYNLGIILNNLGKLKDAEKSTRIAIELNPKFTNAYYNHGKICKDLGKLKDAEISARKAIELNPNFANGHTNLGSIFRDLGRLKDAESSTRTAIELKPNNQEAYFNLGFILNDIGQSQEALDSYLKVIDINDKFKNIYPTITKFLKDSDLSKLNKLKLKKILNILLERNDVSHKELFKVLYFLYKDEIKNKLEYLYSDFSNNELIFEDKMLINALDKTIFSDLQLESLLKSLRKKICFIISENIKTLNNSKLDFIIALGKQCFLNEYIYTISEEENICLNNIINKCKNGEISKTKVSILSCYYPLYKLLDKIPLLNSFNSSHKGFKELIELQIKEPLKEIKLSKRIKSIGRINNNISKKVKSQYEENPYPRWKFGDYAGSHTMSIEKGINNEIKPNFISHKSVNEQLKVLIAGCGTGNQILQTQRYKNVQITAIDLSLSSLAYAKRKINEIKIDNVELIQMDILNINLLDTQFDVIECGGVLHHMNKPEKGLKALLDVLKKDGFLKLGLYSKLARRDIVKAKEYISNKKLQPNEDDIRNFRQKVISGELRDLNSLKTFKDFYSLSELRDLCFHAKEHRFTIDQLRETCINNKLEFLGFLLPQSFKSLYEKNFPEDKKQIDLKNWAKFEDQHPNTFSAMYQFWVSKKENK